jgi:hypothetical protein
MHLYHTITEPRYLTAFATTALLMTGGFMLMPFSSAYLVATWASTCITCPRSTW